MNDPERDDWPSVSFDDRCAHCTAGDGEACDPWCECPSCLRQRAASDLDVVPEDAGVLVKKD